MEVTHSLHSYLWLNYNYVSCLVSCKMIWFHLFARNVMRGVTKSFSSKTLQTNY